MLQYISVMYSFSFVANTQRHKNIYMHSLCKEHLCFHMHAGLMPVLASRALFTLYPLCVESIREDPCWPCSSGRTMRECVLCAKQYVGLWLNVCICVCLCKCYHQKKKKITKKITVILMPEGRESMCLHVCTDCWRQFLAVWMCNLNQQFVVERVFCISFVWLSEVKQLVCRLEYLQKQLHFFLALTSHALSFL